MLFLSPVLMMNFPSSLQAGHSGSSEKYPWTLHSRIMAVRESTLINTHRSRAPDSIVKRRGRIERAMDAIVAGWVRTPFHRAHKGALAGVRPDTMVAECIKEVVRRLELDPAEVDDVIVGCAYPEGEQGYNIGRMASLLAGLPDTVPGMTINRLCGSSMQAVISAANAIRVGQGQCYIVAGVESMSRVKRRGSTGVPPPSLGVRCD